MFVQVIQGKVRDPQEVKAQLDRWRADLAPGATGWLSSTSGVTPDEEFISFVCFESREAAEHNSHRPEQHQWWMETAKLFEGEVQFHDSTEVSSQLAGFSERAGFVQLMQGRVRDVPRMRVLDEEFERLVPAERPEILGSAVALHGDDEFIMASYFTSEEEAREGERKQLSPELKRLMDEEWQLLGDVRFFDLPDPWLHRAG